MPKTDLYVSAESKKVHSLEIVKIFSKVVKNIIKIIKHKKHIMQQDNKNLSWNKNLLDFIQIFYQSKVFDYHKKEKTLFDSFMIFNELYETLYPIRDIQNK